MKHKVVFSFIILFFILFSNVMFQNHTVFADELNDAINEQVENIDFTELENFFSEIEANSNFNFSNWLNKILNGQFDFSFSSIFDFIINVLFSDIKSFIPMFISVVIIAILCGLLKNIRASSLSEGVGNVVVFVCLSAIVLLIGGQIITLFGYAKNTIENIAKLTEIMSPIITVLMIGSGASVSASVYTPSAMFFSVGIINIVLSVVMPLVGLIIIFSLN